MICHAIVFVIFTHVGVIASINRDLLALKGQQRSFPKLSWKVLNLPNTPMEVISTFSSTMTLNGFIFSSGTCVTLNTSIDCTPNPIKGRLSGRKIFMQVSPELFNIAKL